MPASVPNVSVERLVKGNTLRWGIYGNGTNSSLGTSHSRRFVSSFVRLGMIMYDYRTNVAQGSCEWYLYCLV